MISHKFAASIISEMFSMPPTKQDFDNEMNNIKNVAIAKAYNSSMINKVISKER